MNSREGDKFRAEGLVGKRGGSTVSRSHGTVRVRVCVRVCACVCVRERESERDRECVCLSLSLCVCVIERVRLFRSTAPRVLNSRQIPDASSQKSSSATLDLVSPL